MPSPNLLFLGSKANYSKLVKKDLIKAGYQCINTPDQADLFITACHGQILPQEILKKPKYGALNIHPSLLPKYRGAAPVPWTLLNKDKTTGVTVFQMDSGIDTGPILAQEKTTISPQETAEDLLNRLFKMGTKLLIDILPDYIEDNLSPIPQPASSPTPYARKFTKKDGFITWKDFVKASKTNQDNLQGFNPCKLFDHKIRAFYPWPGLWTKMPNGKILKLLPGQKFQLEGKSPISWQQFLNGYANLLK